MIGIHQSGTAILGDRKKAFQGKTAETQGSGLGIDHCKRRRGGSGNVPDGIRALQTSGRHAVHARHFGFPLKIGQGRFRLLIIDECDKTINSFHIEFVLLVRNKNTE